MITREELRELSQFRFQDGTACAISFYFQPDPPHNKAHLEQLIYAKDLVRDAMREVLNNGKNTGAQADLEKVLSLAEQLHSVSPRAKAAFACGCKTGRSTG